MKNTFGHSVAVTLFGESHGEYIGAVLDGLAPGLVVDEDFIRHQLYKGRPHKGLRQAVDRPNSSGEDGIAAEGDQ